MRVNFFVEVPFKKLKNWFAKSRKITMKATAIDEYMKQYAMTEHDMKRILAATIWKLDCWSRVDTHWSIEELAQRLEGALQLSESLNNQSEIFCRAIQKVDCWSRVDPAWGPDLLLTRLEVAMGLTDWKQSKSKEKEKIKDKSKDKSKSKDKTKDKTKDKNWLLIMKTEGDRDRYLVSVPKRPDEKHPPKMIELLKNPEIFKALEDCFYSCESDEDKCEQAIRTAIKNKDEDFFHYAFLETSDGREYLVWQEVPSFLRQ